MTRKEFNKKHALELDEAWHRKYPNGCFMISVSEGYNWDGPIRNGCPTEHTIVYKLHLMLKRDTSYEHFSGGIHVGIVQYLDGHFGSLIKDPYRSDSVVAKCYYYDSFDKMIESAQKKNIPAKLIAAFKNRYKQL